MHTKFNPFENEEDDGDETAANSERFEDATLATPKTGESADSLTCSTNPTPVNKQGSGSSTVEKKDFHKGLSKEEVKINTNVYKCINNE